MASNGVQELDVFDNINGLEQFFILFFPLVSRVDVGKEGISCHRMAGIL